MKSYRNIIFILVVLAVAAYMVIPNNPGFLGRAIETRLGLDLVGGVQVLLEADVPEDQEISDESMREATRIVENRVGGFGGTSEAVVQQAGDRYIVVEIPDVQDPEQAIATIRETALLEFVDMSSISPDQANAMEGATIQTDFQGGPADPGEVITPTQGVDDRIWPTVMTGSAIETVGIQANELGQPVVSFKLRSDSVGLFREFTSTHVGDALAIVLDKEVISAPVINDAITDGQGIISGQFTTETANQLAVQLRYGSLPIPLKVVETRTVGPTLGQDSLQKSLQAGLIGFAVVILFMGLYYRLPGVLANIAILMYALLTFALFRFIPITLTLPGIAGLMLSTGSALDANILIFERLKEELRSGRTLRQAIDLAWQRAWPSIRDSNIATIITCAILFWFGSAFGATIVKGFSLTLLLGVLVSLFTAIMVTRTLLNLVLQRFQTDRLDLEKWFGI